MAGAAWHRTVKWLVTLLSGSRMRCCLSSPFLFSSGPRLMGWRLPQVGWVSSSPVTQVILDPVKLTVNTNHCIKVTRFKWWFWNVFISVTVCPPTGNVYQAEWLHAKGTSTDHSRFWNCNNKIAFHNSENILYLPISYHGSVAAGSANDQSLLAGFCGHHVILGILRVYHWNREPWWLDFIDSGFLTELLTQAFGFWYTQ